MNRIVRVVKGIYSTVGEGLRLARELKCARDVFALVRRAILALTVEAALHCLLFRLGIALWLLGNCENGIFRSFHNLLIELLRRFRSCARESKHHRTSLQFGSVISIQGDIRGYFFP